MRAVCGFDGREGDADLDGLESDRRARLEALFSAHGEAVFAFARRRTSAAEAEEVVSESFLVAWRRIDDIPAHALPWLLNVAHKTLANRRRGDARQAALRLRLVQTSRAPRQADEPDPMDGPVPEAVLRSLAALSTGERDALTLLAWDGLTPEEAASVLGCSRAAIYLRIHRARRRFARSLGDDAPVTHPGKAQR